MDVRSSASVTITGIELSRKHTVRSCEAMLAQSTPKVTVWLCRRAKKYEDIADCWAAFRAFFWIGVELSFSCVSILYLNKFIYPFFPLTSQKSHPLSLWRQCEVIHVLLFQKYGSFTIKLSFFSRTCYCICSKINFSADFFIDFVLHNFCL